MVRSSNHARIVGAIVIALAAAASIGGGSASGASSAVTVTLNVLSQTEIDPAGCQPSTPGATTIAAVQGGGSSTTSADCRIVFGSTNDASSLRVSQTDTAGQGMFRRPHGPLDTGFGVAGLREVNVGAAANEVTRDIATYPDGRSIIVLRQEQGGTRNVGLVRLLADGTPDPAFDTDGWNIWNETDEYEPEAVFLLDDGRILVIGMNNAAGNRRFFAARYTTVGQLDPTYGAGGYAYVNFGGGTEGAMAGLVQPDGKLVMVGYTGSTTAADIGVARLNADGSPDLAFNGTGRRTIAVAGAQSDRTRAVTMLPDGDLVVIGHVYNGASYDLTTLRLNSDGSTENLWDGDGERTFVVGALDDYNIQYHADVRLMPDGTLLIADTVDLATNQVMTLRVTTTGAPVASWGVAGRADVSVTPGAQEVEIAPYPDGSVMLAGATSGGFDGIVIALNTTGGLDTSFDVDGWRTFNPGTSDWFRTAAIGTDGRLLLAGAAFADSGSGRVSVYGLDSTRISDYASPATDWDSVGTNTFGGCLASVAGTGLISGWTTDAGGNCATTDADSWYPITPAPVTILRTPSAQVGVVANLRFGARTTTSQLPGTYMAPITFEVIAPAI